MVNETSYIFYINNEPSHILYTGGGIMGKKISKANHGKSGAELISEAFGMTKNDSEALLAQASEVQTTDIPLGKEHVYARDSTTTTLNNLLEDNTSAILDRNGPR